MKAEELDRDRLRPTTRGTHSYTVEYRHRFHEVVEFIQSRHFTAEDALTRAVTRLTYAYPDGGFQILDVYPTDERGCVGGLIPTPQK